MKPDRQTAKLIIGPNDVLRFSNGNYQKKKKKNLLQLLKRKLIVNIQQRIYE